MRTFRLLPLWILILPLLLAWRGEAKEITFRQLSVDRGLSQSTVTAMAQDPCGNLWLGTRDGLNRYDGYDFRAFHADASDSLSLADNAITVLRMAENGPLWIGTESGLSCYDFQAQRFKNFKGAHLSTTLCDIHVTEECLYLGTNEGVVLFDPRRGEVVETLLAGIRVRVLCPTADGSALLLGTENGLYRYHLTRRETLRLAESTPSYDLSCIVPAPSGGYWVSTHGNGLLRLDEEFRLRKHFLSEEYKALSSNYIRTLRVDPQGRLWIGSYNGLILYDEAEGHFSCYMHTPGESSSISHNSVWSIFVDNQQGVWVGTYYGGVNYYHPLASRFQTLRCDNHSAASLDGTVSCIVEDGSSGDLWVGTNDDGLFRYEAASGRFVHQNDPSLHLSNGIGMADNIKSILPDGEAGLWVGTHIGGLSYLHRASRRIENFPIQTMLPINNGCYALLSSEDGKGLWVGTLGGLMYFDKATRRFSRHAAAEREKRLASGQIMALMRDREGSVWIGSDQGLYRCSSDGAEVRSLNGLKLEDGSLMGSRFVQSLLEDSEGAIWVGTKQGLFRYDQRENSLKRYTVSDGLPNNQIFAILEDDDHRLWISTNKGLSCFDIVEGRFRNYDQREGLSGNQFHSQAACRDHFGNFYFGGLGGITAFRPSEMEENPHASPPHIVELTVFDDSAPENQQVERRRQSTGELKACALSSSYNLIRIRFSAANLLAGDRNSYRYTLEGFDDRWWSTTQREVVFSNLAPGSYRFRLQAANSDGRWSDREALLELRILPRWWQTWAARGAFLALFLLLLWLLMRILTSRMKIALELDMERKEKERIEEISQEKIRFYINLSHELRTPLTLILSPLKEIEEQGTVDKFVRSRLEYIYRSSNRLLHIVNRMLDFRKAELGMFKLHVVEQEVDLVAGGIFSLFEEVAQNRDMDYILNSELKGERLPVDRMFLEMMLTNLLTNAFKFTRSGGLIRLHLSHSGGRLLITVRDNGIGIHPKDQKRVFERFCQVDESRAGSGIGLSLVARLVELHHGEISLRSEVGEYSEFTISLPDSLEAYTLEERGGEPEQSSIITPENLPQLLDEASLNEQESLPAGEESEDSEREAILMVVEDREIQRYLSEHFRSRYRLFSASDGVAALEMLKTIEPAVIIADRILNGVDGLKLCQSVKQNIRTCHIPVVIIASKESPEEQLLAIEAGADDYVGQPFSINLLQAKVQNLLKSRYRLRHHYSASSEIEPEKITSNAIDGEFLRRAIEVVEKNLDNEEFSSNDFAQALCMSRSNLHLKMTSITGESATKFIRKIRFNHACKLLLERKYTISEISSMVGFNSPSYFATSFKKHVGCLPTEYLKNN